MREGENRGDLEAWAVRYRWVARKRGGGLGAPWEEGGDRNSADAAVSQGGMR